MARFKKTESRPIEIDTWWCLKHLCNHMYMVRQGCPHEKAVHILSRAKEADQLMAEVEVKLARLEAGFEPLSNVPLADVKYVSASRMLEVEDRVDSLIEQVIVSEATNKSKGLLTTLLMKFCRKKEDLDLTQAARLGGLKRRLLRLEDLYEELRREKWSDDEMTTQRPITARL
ncbi:hypothetical protein Slin15195_G008770 [Septoria linicola]|uniref:Uncharacterized protein n=1 Tax=Septoria linicola TaxID=215465 RepID=A0A9Q9AII3_9PEZI|nr:hypothetical protein Slin14017_G008780 [Septoria linicola]USW47558.1 hypothetical protein Slin15195_G008770 [Septoria linicola]